jgi:aminobenzoyl-glutamate transport protein
MNYFALIVVFAEKYDKDSGTGTLITTMIPYSIILLVIWSVLGFDLGPGVGVML